MSDVMVRPERAEELRIEAESRAAGGPWAYTGTRHCPACDCERRPVHPDDTDRQSCENCGADLPGDPVTWAVRETPGGAVFVLRHGDYCAAGGAPQRSGDDDVDTALAANVWLNLGYQLQLVTLYPMS